VPASKNMLSPDWGVLFLKPQPFHQDHPSAPKTQWVMVAALWYRRSDWPEPLRLLWGRLEGKGAVGRRSPFPVTDSKKSTPPSPGLKLSTLPARDAFGPFLMEALCSRVSGDVALLSSSQGRRVFSFSLMNFPSVQALITD
jgi:hypothetical protein